MYGRYSFQVLGSASVIVEHFEFRNFYNSDCIRAPCTLSGSVRIRLDLLAADVDGDFKRSIVFVQLRL